MKEELELLIKEYKDNLLHCYGQKDLSLSTNDKELKILYSGKIEIYRKSINDIQKIIDKCK